MNPRRKVYVTVWPNRFQRGMRALKDAKRLQGHAPVEAQQALLETYTTDAHLWPGFGIDPDGVRMPLCPRINVKGLRALENAGYRIGFDLVFVDVDCPDAHRHKKAASIAWRTEQRKLLGNLPVVIAEGMGWYDTRGGYRLVWILDRSLGIEGYVSIRNDLYDIVAKAGIVPDRLKDWGRCYRLPKVRRDREDQRFDFDFSNLFGAEACFRGAPKDGGLQ
jgi:hypothetical protein